MSNRTKRPRRHPRRGATLALAAMFLALMLGMVAFAVDVGYIVLTRTQLQVSADSAAMAAAATNMNGSFGDVVAMATQYAGFHNAGGKPVGLHSDDVELGIWNREPRTFTTSTSQSNAVRVTTRRDGTINDNAPLFFARIFGANSCALKTEATAAYTDNFSGFRQPPSGENLPVLPIALSVSTWQDLLDGRGSDDWFVDPDSRDVRPGSDDSIEVRLYPQDTGLSEHNGLISIGGGVGTSALAQRILNGISPQDLSEFGGSLELGEGGTLQLDGVPGLRASLANEFAAIEGQTRIVPIFSQVAGHGRNAVYTIVQFAAVCIVEVDLSGRDKRVMVQPANLVIRWGIPSSDTTRTSYHIFSPVQLVR